MNRRQTVRRSVALALCVCLCLTACSPLQQLTPGTELTIRLPDQLPPHRLATIEAATRSEANVAAGAGVAAGGALGASAGLSASVACGFAIIICAPVFMIAGGVTGVGAAGVVEAATRDSEPPRDSSRENLQDLERRLAAFAQANEPHEQFRRVLADRASAHWRVVPASTKNTLTVQLADFALRAESEERITLEVRVAVNMESEDALSTSASRPPLAPMIGVFAYQGSAATLGQWMDASGDFLNTEVARAYEALARQIVAAMNGRGLG